MIFKFLRVFLLLSAISPALLAQVKVSSFSPSSGPANTTVTINGSGFNATATNNAVYFGDVKASVVTATTTTITARVPSTAIYGNIAVLNLTNGFKGLSPQFFNVTFPQKGVLSGLTFETSAVLTDAGSVEFETTGDINGDGRPDIVTLDYENGYRIGILINRANGDSLNQNTFLPKVIIPIAAGGNNVQIQDFDGDGKLDIMTNSDKKLLILRNKFVSGTLTANSFESIQLNTAFDNSYFLLTDVDGDGRPDILAYTTAFGGRDPQLGVFKNNSTPGNVSADLLVPVAPIPPTTAYTRAFCAADLSGDGRAELIFSGAARGITVYENLTATNGLGNSSFRPVVFDIDKPTAAVSVADIDGDNKPDLLFVGDESHVMYVLKNVMTGSEINTASFVLKEKIYSGKVPVGIKVADFDGDGKVDAATLNLRDSSISVFKNLATPGAITPWFAPKVNFSISAQPKTMLVADFNADNKPDMLFLAKGGAAIIVKNKPIPIPHITSFAPFSGKIGSIVKVKGENFGTDLSNITASFDSRKAKITAVSDNEFSVIVPPGVSHSRIAVNIKSDKRSAWSGERFRVTFAAKKNIERSDFKQVILSLPQCDGRIRFSDLDGDGAVDMIYWSTNADIVAQRNIGPAGAHIDCNTFSSEVITIGHSDYFGSSFMLKDINADGLPDLICTGEEGFFHNTVYLNTSIPGKISFKEISRFDDVSALMDIEDIDNDGKMDYITPHTVYRNQFTENEKNTPYKDRVKLPYEDGYYALANLLDIDGDGKLDAFGLDDQEPGIKMNAGVPGILTDSSFTKLKLKMNFSFVSVQDMDADGKSDVVLATQFYKNTSTVNNIELHDDVKIANKLPDAYTDLNGDGLPDLLTGEINNFAEEQDTAMIYQNIALPGGVPVYNKFVKYPYNYGSPQDHLSTGVYQATEDINNDGKPDLVFYNDTHTVYIFENAMTDVESDLPPQIASFSPKTASVGGTVTINATNISNSPWRTEVYIGNQKAEIKSINAGTITVVVPAGASRGRIAVLDTLTRLKALSDAPFSVQFNDGKGADFTVNLFKPLKNVLNKPKLQTPIGDFFYADLYNDGEKEFLVSGYVLKASAKDQFNNPSAFTTSFELKSAARVAAVADISGDNKPELIGDDNAPSNGIAILENASSKSCGFDFFQGSIRSEAFDGRGRSLVDDINNDGKPDLITASAAYSSVTIFLNQAKRGSVSFNPFDKVFKMVATDGRSLSIFGLYSRDFDGDGKNDLFVNTERGLYIYRNAGSGKPNELNFDEPLLVDVSFGSDIIIEDLNDDGKPEIIYSSAGGAEVRIYKNISTQGKINSGSIGPKISLPQAESYVSAIALSDIDGDGKPDFIFSHNQSGILTFYRNKTTGSDITAASFSNKIDIDLGATVANFIVEDFNRDGKPDILVNMNGQSIGVLQNNLFNEGLLSLSGSVTALEYTAGDNAVPIDAAIAITKTTTDNISSAQVAISAGFNAATDTLIFTNVAATMGNIAASYDKATGALNLLSAGNTATTAQWQAALRGVMFKSNATINSAKTISFTSAAGVVQSPVITRTINVKVIPPPVITSCTPVHAAKGTVVTINGSGFSSITGVMLGGKNAASFTIVSDTQITAVVDTAINGVITVNGKYGAGTRNGFIFLPVPVISPAGPHKLNAGGSIVLSVNPVSGVTYQWFKNGSALVLATGDKFTVTAAGEYIVKATADGQTLTSAMVAVTEVFTLPATNFAISAVSVTCKGAKNGSINIAAQKSLSYTATLSGNGINQSKPFTGTVAFTGLGPGTYNVCITVAGQTDYNQCFTSVVTEPKDLALFANVIDNNKIELRLDGADTYHISVDGVEQTTREDRLTLTLHTGINRIAVSADKLCQGVLSREFVIADRIVPFPNPFTEVVYVNLGEKPVKNTTVYLYDVYDKLVLQQTFVNASGVVRLETGGLRLGVYVLRVVSDGSSNAFKLIKK